MLRTEYQQQMNELTQVFATRPGTINSLLLKRDGHRYEAFVQKISDRTTILAQWIIKQENLKHLLTSMCLGMLLVRAITKIDPNSQSEKNAVEVKIPRERTAFGDIPEYGGDGKLRGKNPYSSDRTGYIE